MAKRAYKAEYAEQVEKLCLLGAMIIVPAIAIGTRFPGRRSPV